MRAFLQRLAYQRNQALLLETPPVGGETAPDRAAAQAVIAAALADGRSMLDEAEAKAVLAAYGIAVVPTRQAATPEQVAQAAAGFAPPLALKIRSPDLSHKSDVGGVILDLPTPAAAAEAAAAMRARLAASHPHARLDGFTVQPMHRREGAVELIVGASCDAVFGPTLLFGQGGVAVELIGDRAVGLPPLNRSLAREMMGRTRVDRLLDGFRSRPAVDRAAIERVLVAVSQLVCELPGVMELDINPLLAGADGAVALDARIVVTQAAGPGHARLAIRPYPAEEERWLDWHGEPVLLRPIRPEDEPAHREFFESLSPADIRARFFAAVRPAHDQLARFTQIDYEREMAFVAVRRDADGRTRTLGVARAVSDPDNLVAEFAVVVRSDLKRRGLGRALLTRLVEYCRGRGTGTLFGQTLAGNLAMRRLAESLGFEAGPCADPELIELRLRLAPPR
ncbi:bifunctional acetate--CoA ligase family protein/GNAT family N-acetyltransferase [Chitinimonas koreensis]|uniref:bifunctional acetate--CoA ligase family protein/GNAT family N-acetyltransferase n=1 Tax=Chitinimonas koreensis TaxID=356302 RepID=UPI001FE05363|nr:GNAT family N-acetyltransferase [Chitinimonas koreensis]